MIFFLILIVIFVVINYRFVLLILKNFDILKLSNIRFKLDFFVFEFCGEVVIRNIVDEDIKLKVDF